MAADGDIRENLRQFEMESDRLAELFGGMGMTEPATVPSVGKPKSKGPNKCYSVIDFVSFANSTHGDEETELLSDNNGTSIIMKNSPRKPKIQEVTLSQWVSANARIMSKLIADRTPETYLIIWSIHRGWGIWYRRTRSPLWCCLTTNFGKIRLRRAPGGQNITGMHACSTWKSGPPGLAQNSLQNGMRVSGKPRTSQGNSIVWITTMNWDASVLCAAIRMYVQRRAARLHTHSTNMALSIRSASAPAAPSQHV